MLKLLVFAHGKNDQNNVMVVLKQPSQDRINFHKMINLILIILTTVYVHLVRSLTLFIVFNEEVVH